MIITFVKYFVININNYSSISGNITVNIYAINGTRMLTQSIAEGSTQFDLSSLVAGMYIIEVIGDSTVLTHQKFTKQ